MKIVNETPFACHLARVICGPTGMLACVIVKTTYDISDDANPRLAEEQEAVNTQPTLSSLGTDRQAELGWRRGAVDLLVEGHAIARDLQPVANMVAGFSIGSYSSHAHVHGRRVWEKRWGRLTPSGAEPFVKLPLTWAHAFGGEAKLGDYVALHPENPSGKGYFMAAADAVDGELAQIEDPDAPVSAWNDHPPPIGFTDISELSRYRADSMADIDGLARRTLFNISPPRHRMPLGAFKPGMPIRIFGMTAAGALRFSLPIRAVDAHVALGRFETILQLQPDTLRFSVDDRKLTLIYRAAFKYKRVLAHRRVVRLRERSAP